jgi:hypothetical protein
MHVPQVLWNTCDAFSWIARMLPFEQHNDVMRSFFSKKPEKSEIP